MESNKMVCYSEIKNTATLEPEIKITHDSKIEADYLLLKRNNTKPTEKKPGLRAVSKNGEYNIHHSKVSRKFLLRDIFVTLVDMKWRWTITIFSAGFFGSWTWFAIGWWLIAFIHGDLEENHLPMNQAASNWTPCVMDIYDFTSCFLFSVETQHTTGYGEKRPTEKCVDAVLLMCLQNIAGLIIEVFFVGIIFAKMTRPKLRTKTIQFSEHAVICIRDSVLCLVIRIGDLRNKSRLIAPRIKAHLIRERKTKEGECFSNYLTKLSVSVDDCEGDFFLVWPITLVHKIDKRSPLYNISLKDPQKERFEIVVTLEATVESTDQKTQARSSYLSEEILWGRRFDSMISLDEGKLGYEVDYSKFNETVEVDMPLCSAAEFEQMNQTEKGKS